MAVMILSSPLSSTAYLSYARSTHVELKTQTKSIVSNKETGILSLCSLEQTTLTYLGNQYQATAAMGCDAKKPSIVSVGQVDDSSPGGLSSVQEPLIKQKHSPENYCVLAAIPPFLFPALGAFLFGYEIGATSCATVSIKVGDSSSGGPSSVQEPLIKQKHSPENYCVLAAIPPFLFPALGAFLFGYEIGATSCATLSIKSPTLSGISWYNLSSVDVGIITSCSHYGALIGSIVAFNVADIIGRRKELITAALLYLVGAIVTATALVFPVLIIGRVVYGIGLGLVGDSSSGGLSSVQEPLIKQKHTPENYSVLAAIPPFLFPALGAFLFGYEIGATSCANLSIIVMALTFLPLCSLHSFVNYSAFSLALSVPNAKWNFLTSCSHYGALIGSIVAFNVADIIGRRKELITAALLYLVGAIVTATAPVFPVLIIGRVVYGIGLGLHSS
ncbi:hypothetical protein F2Q69_00002950 [Brassica cretica]|uniref:Major facilitator superfamily (MFS) profile domain-containing protein n=1 Tax=Brassica cretica TaxID=69181 RepID=A0A8S9P0M5_BRACR|nr:hypothetical protein F2Q69_00002950 [Brassica cretica]